MLHFVFHVLRLLVSLPMCLYLPRKSNSLRLYRIDYNIILLKKILWSFTDCCYVYNYLKVRVSTTGIANYNALRHIYIEYHGAISGSTFLQIVSSTPKTNLLFQNCSLEIENEDTGNGFSQGPFVRISALIFVFLCKMYYAGFLNERVLERFLTSFTLFFSYPYNLFIVNQFLYFFHDKLNTISKIVILYLVSINNS